MNGPNLPNPFETFPAGGDPFSAHKPAPEVTLDNPLDAAIAQALHSQPLAAPPPLLYAAVMRSVRLEMRPRFRLHWLDLALSLFAAGMLLAIWWALRSLPQLWLDYVRLEVLYQINKLWYLNFPLLLWGAAAAAGLLACLAAVLLSRPRPLSK